MSSSLLQLLVLAGIAVFLIVKLRSVLGTREGFEKPPIPLDDIRPDSKPRRDFEVIEGGPDRDIIDHVPDGSAAAKALAGMKLAESGFNVSTFLSGARGAYEMILMSYEKGELDRIREFHQLLRTVGVALGDTTAARAVSDSVQRTLEAVRRRTRAWPRVRVVWPLWDRPLLVVGQGSYLDELLEVAGGINVFHDLEAPSPAVSV